jgi:hypothetical protein
MVRLPGTRISIHVNHDPSLDRPQVVLDDVDVSLYLEKPIKCTMDSRFAYMEYTISWSINTVWTPAAIMRSSFPENWV